MGAMGSDAAIEAADVVLMDDDPIKIAKAIRTLHVKKFIEILERYYGYYGKKKKEK